MVAARLLPALALAALASLSLTVPAASRVDRSVAVSAAITPPDRIVGYEGGARSGLATTAPGARQPPFSLWSDPATWGGRLPAEGAAVTIPAGKRVLVNTDVPRLEGVTVHGELHFQDRPTTFRSKYIVVYGRLVAGTATAPLRSRVTISLEGETAPVVRMVAGMDVGANVLVAARGGTIDLHGTGSGRMRTKLARTANAGARTIHLLHPVRWQRGARIVLSSTTMDFRHYDEATVAGRSADGRTITLAGPLRHQHRSVVTRFRRGSETRSVAERGDVGLLSKNLVVTGDANPARRFSGHTIVLSNSVMRVSDVEFAYLGQEGVLGRYPLHWHFTGNASRSYARNTSIHHAFNRFFSVHRTNNLRVSGGVWHDTIGHGFMLEDGVEVNNKVSGILAMTIRRPADGKRLRRSDDVPSAFWITHPSNDLVDIVAAGGEGAGIWYDFNFNSDNTGIFGAIRRPLGRVANLEAHSHLQLWGKEFPNHAAGGGIVIEGYFGNLAGGRQSIQRLHAWKNERYGLWLDGPYTARGIYGANNGIAYNGQDTAAAGGLLVGSTANTGSEERQLKGLIRFYHGQADVDDMWLANFDQRRGSSPDKVAITDTTASSNDATNRVRRLRFFGPGYRVLFSHNSPYHDPNLVRNSHWFEDVDGSVRGNGVRAVITNRQMFIRSRSDTPLHRRAGKDWFQGSDFGAHSAKAGRGFARFIAGGHTFSMTRLDTGETATRVEYPGVTLGLRYRVNGLPDNVDIQVRGSEPGWFELELPGSRNPTSMTVQGGGFNRTLTRASALAGLGSNGDYYWDGATRTLYLRIVISGTPIPFGRGGDYRTIRGDWASWRVRR